MAAAAAAAVVVANATLVAANAALAAAPQPQAVVAGAAGAAIDANLGTLLRNQAITNVALAQQGVTVAQQGVALAQLGVVQAQQGAALAQLGVAQAQLGVVQAQHTAVLANIQGALVSTGRALRLAPHARAAVSSPVRRGVRTSRVAPMVTVGELRCAAWTSGDCVGTRARPRPRATPTRRGWVPRVRVYLQANIQAHMGIDLLPIVRAQLDVRTYNGHQHPTAAYMEMPDDRGAIPAAADGVRRLSRTVEQAPTRNHGPQVPRTHAYAVPQRATLCPDTTVSISPNAQWPVGLNRAVLRGMGVAQVNQLRAFYRMPAGGGTAETRKIELAARIGSTL